MKPLDDGITLTSTKLTWKELAKLHEHSVKTFFQEHIVQRPKGFLGLFSSPPIGEVDFATPKDDSPFDALNDNQPALGASGIIPVRGKGDHMKTLFYVWDGPDRRIARLLVLYMYMDGYTATQLIRAYVAAVHERDSGIHVQEFKLKAGRA